MSEDLYNKLVEMSGKMGEVIAESLSIKIDDLRLELTEKIEKVHVELTEKIEKVRVELTEKIDSEVAALSGRMDELTQNMDELTQNMDDLAQNMIDLTHYTKRRIEVAELRQQSNDARIEAIEVELRDIKAQFNAGPSAK